MKKKKHRKWTAPTNKKTNKKKPKAKTEKPRNENETKSETMNDTRFISVTLVSFSRFQMQNVKATL